MKSENPAGTKRTPDYVRGKTGVVLVAHGVIQDYEHDHADFRGPAYSVIFSCKDLFGEESGSAIVVDIHENWLERA